MRSRTPLPCATDAFVASDWSAVVSQAYVPWRDRGPLQLTPLARLVAWLGILGTCAAYILFFTLIQNVGATRASMVTYVIPVVGVILGVIFLHERLDWYLGGGTLLVIAGIWVVNTRLRLACLKRKPVPLEEPPQIK